MSVSAIVTTYNRSGPLRNCIAALEAQTRPPDEVVIADDGSDPDHVAVIQDIIRDSSLDVVYVRQEHDGFRAAASRNNGVRASTGDLLLFTDGDVTLFPRVVELHVRATRKGHWSTGNRVCLTEEETSRLTTAHIRERRLHDLWPPSGDGRVKHIATAHARFLRKSRWARLLPVEFMLRKVRMTGLSSVHREDFERVNGFDERFVGWGREDDDLALRLNLAGVRGNSLILCARAIHLYHPMEPRVPKGKRKFTSANNDYHNRRRRGEFRCRNGLLPPPDSNCERHDPS